MPVALAAPTAVGSFWWSLKEVRLGAPLQPHSIARGVNYVHHPHHRNWNPNKSQWTISETEERTAFQNAHTRRWIRGNEGWGLHLTAGVVGYLGVGQDHIERLIVAKFVAGNAQNLWHGYPADHCNPADAPDEDVIKDWLANEVLPATKISKIHGGKKCKL